MKTNPNPLPTAAAAFATLVSLLEIVGWQFHIPVLTDPFHANFMAPNTALCFIAASLALLCQSESASHAARLFSKFLSASVVLAGLLVTLEYITAWDPGFDRWFMPHALLNWSLSDPFPGRFAPNTGVAFCFLGTALFATKVSFGKFRLAEIIVLPALLLSFLTLIGYAYGAENLSGLPRYGKMAPQTAVCFAALSLGVLWLRRSQGLMGVVLGDNVSGIAARRLLMSTVTILPVLGFLRIQFHMQGALELRFGTAVLVISSVVIFCFMILHTTFILADIDEKRRRAEESVLRSRDELQFLVEKRTAALRELSSRLMRAQDESQRKIAGDLHEGFGQDLVALNLKLAQAANRPANSQVLHEATALLDKTIHQIKAASYSLHPPLLEEVGFSSAAGWFVEDFASRTAIQVRLRILGSLPKLSSDVELGLYRVLQETLGNVQRHSGSTSAEVRIEKTASAVIMEIQDFGKGMDPAILEDWNKFGVAGVGLTGMKERLSELRGNLEVESDPRGTIVRAMLPVSIKTG